LLERIDVQVYINEAYVSAFSNPILFECKDVQVQYY